MHVGHLGGGDDLFQGDVARVVAVRDVVADGALEQHGLLLHQPKLRAQARQRQVASRVAPVEALRTVAYYKSPVFFYPNYYKR